MQQKHSLSQFNASPGKYCYKIALAVSLALSPTTMVLASIGGEKPTLQTQDVQHKTLKGKVLDAKGEPIIGATVRVEEEPSNGTTTNTNGAFVLQNLKPGQHIAVSCIGYKTTRITVGTQKELIVKLQEDATVMDEVVVIGAGTQKKVSITGAITSVKGGLLKVPSTSLTTAFAGQLAGVISMTNSGAPGSPSEFYIRGISTFGGRATPLIMLDDVEISASDLNNIPAETIESFSILKDASATAIYGSRGANGVMIVKTKAGNTNERTKVNVTVENSFNIPQNFPQFVDGATWMELYNEALLSRNPHATPRYTQERIDATRSGIDPIRYPNVNWQDVLFRKMSMSQRANLNIQGGGSKATYYMSLQANHDSGILKSNKVHSWDNNINNWGYNFQNNISYNLTPTTKVDLRMNAQIRNKQGGNYNVSDLFDQVLSGNNPINFPVTFPAQEGDTHIRFGSSVISGENYRTNPYATLLNTFKETQENTINTSLKLSQGLDFLTPGLSATLLVNFKNWSQQYYTRSIQPYLYRIKEGSYNPETKTYELQRLGTSGTDYIAQSDIVKQGNRIFFLQGTLDYNRKFGNHTLNGMLLYMQREFKDNVLPHRNQGFSGRFMYNYFNRYFAELNFGYTGTERLAKDRRFEFFPALSVGWAISEEKFFEPLTDYVSFLKLRSSYGLIGSDETGTGAGHYLYIDRVTLNSEHRGFTTGENLDVTRRGPLVDFYAVENASWERVKKFNVGVDMELFRALNITAEYFFDRRYNILLHREAFPQSLGYDSAKPWANKGKVNNWGWELSANYNRRITQDLSMDIRGNFTYTQNKIVDIDDPIYKYPWQARTGKPLSRSEGLVAEGLFSSMEEVKNSPDQTAFGSNPLPGDIKYRDINGDGVITNEDRVMISPYGTTPRIQFGFGASMQYKAFDLSVFFNGSAMRSITTGLMAPFGQTDNNVFTMIANNRWTEANPNPNATYPRLGLQTSDTNNNAQASTYWLRDGSFVRFKSLELGYTFKYGRAYFSANNLFVFSPFKDWDPELNWNSYPLQRILNVGLQLTF